MKKHVLLSVAGMIFILSAGSVGAQCPEQPNDNGICDTFYVEVFEDDTLFANGPEQIRFPLRLTNDIPDPSIDSVAGMVISLCFTSSNPTADARVEIARNNTAVLPLPDLENTIFRHLPSMDDPQERNWMMDLSEQGTGVEWDMRILDLVGSDPMNPRDDIFWLALVPTGEQDQLFPGGSRVLVATMTITLDDTTTLCVDTCFWPPTHGQLFSRSDAVTYIPRDNMPYCISIELSEHGDANGDGVINIGDVMYMVNYLYRSGPYPASFEAGDANCDGDHGILDVLILINYLYKGGRPPGCI